MKKKLEKEDNLISEIMKDLQMEKPSEGFTDRIMQSLEMESSISDFKPGPLISKEGWIGIFAGILGITLLLFFLPESQVPAEASWLTQFFSMLNLPSIEISFTNVFSRINFGSPTLLWISIGVAGIGFLAIIERILESINLRNHYLI